MHIYSATLHIVPYRCDQDGDGKINYVEFTKYLIGTHITL